MFEGLPVRQWRQQETLFGAVASTETVTDDGYGFPELPMPRDASLLAPHTQALLRAARKPRFGKPPSKPEQKETEKRDDEDAEAEDPLAWGLVRKWAQISRVQEEPEREYLAKRRKGLPPLPEDAPVLPPDTATRTALIRRPLGDDAFVIYQLILAPDQHLPDEIPDPDTIPVADIKFLPPGTVVDGLGTANAQGAIITVELLNPRRRNRPPIPQKKRKGGPGRGKKKVMFSALPQGGAGVTTSVASTGTATTGAVARSTDPTAIPATADDGEGEGNDDEEGDDDEDDDMGDADDGDDHDDEHDDDDDGEGDGNGDGDGDGDGDAEMDDDLEAGEIYESDRATPVIVPADTSDLAVPDKPPVEDSAASRTESAAPQRSGSLEPRSAEVAAVSTTAPQDEQSAKAAEPLVQDVPIETTVDETIQEVAPAQVADTASELPTSQVEAAAQDSETSAQPQVPVTAEEIFSVVSEVVEQHANEKEKDTRRQDHDPAPDDTKPSEDQRPLDEQDSAAGEIDIQISATEDVSAVPKPSPPEPETVDLAASEPHAVHSAPQSPVRDAISAVPPSDPPVPKDETSGDQPADSRTPRSDAAESMQSGGADGATVGQGLPAEQRTPAADSACDDAGQVQNQDQETDPMHPS